MDPNAALESILRGHMIADHVAALRNWIHGGGFLPAAVSAPADCAEFIAGHCEVTYADGQYKVGIEFTADARGIWSSNPRLRAEGDRMLVATYAQLSRLEDSEY